MDRDQLKRYGAAVGIFLLIASVGAIIQNRRHSDAPDGAKSAEPQTRRAAPDFSLTDLNGKPLRMAELKGRVVIVDFWATWCPPCIDEIPHFKELQRKYEAKGLTIVGLSMDESEKDAREFVQEHGVRYPVAMGSDEIAQQFGGVQGLPTTFIIDRQGQIVEKFLGYRDLEQFEEALKPLL